jgi:hypothetical protein
MTTGIVQTESRHAGGFMVSEAEGRRSRDKAIVALSQTLVAGQVIAKTAVIANVTSSATADASNTGTGAITLDVTTPVAAGAKNGTYRAINNLVAANSGEFEVFDPDGFYLGRVLVGATFNNQIKFVIADATDFAIGDAFSIIVGIEQSDYQVLAFAPAGTDGSQRPAGIIWDNITTDGSNLGACVLISRDAEVRGVDIVWPAGITAIQKADAIRQLEKLRIILR